jgi:hypothetical protein
MTRGLKYAGQFAVYAGVALLFGYFSNQPGYRFASPDAAEIKISFAHAGARAGGCKTWTRKEMAKLAPRDRKPNKCPRTRVPLYLEVLIDDTVLFAEALKPSGLHSDGPAVFYQRFEVRPGNYRLDLRLRDSEREDGFDYRRNTRVSLANGDSLAVDFRVEAGGFILFDRGGVRPPGNDG